MKNEKLLKALGDIDGKYVKEAMPQPEGARAKPFYRYFNTSPRKAMLALAVVVLLMIAMIFSVSALREPVVQFLTEVYEMIFNRNEPEWMYEQETTRYLQESETAPTTAAWHGSGREGKTAGFPGYTWGYSPINGLEMRTDYALYAPGEKEIRVTITNNSGKELMWWGAGEYSLQYWDGYGWLRCSVFPEWGPNPPPEQEMIFEPLPNGKTQTAYSLKGWEAPVEGFYRMTVTARELGEQYVDSQTDFRMQAVFELSSSSTPKLTQELAAKLIPIQTKIIADTPYYPPTPIVRPAEPIVTEPIPSIEETPFSPRDVIEMQQGFWEVGDYVQRIPAKRYKYWMSEEAIFVYFYQHAQGAEDAVLCLKIDGWVDDYVRGKTEMLDDLTENFLIRHANIEFIRFSSAGSAIPPPRGIQIGDPESKIFECYPDIRRGDQSDILYDITAIYPWAKPAQSRVNRDNGTFFIGGQKSAHGNWVFLCADMISEDTEDVPLLWTNPLRLEYQIKDGKIAEIYFSCSFEPE